MSFTPLLGQPAAKTTLERAILSGRVHHAYRFVGPAGVGKETAALILAQALVCEVPTPFACGECSACRRAVTLANEAPHVPRHPDVIFVGRGMYPPSLLGGKSEATGISVEQIRRIVLPRVGMRPHEARSLVFIVHAADELTSGAANALLKTLEEPRSGVHFILLTDRPAKMLDTILSRTLAVRFGPLPDEVVQTLLKQEGLDPELALHSQGSLERARLLSEPEARTAREQFIEALDNAIMSGKVSEALRFANTRPEDRHDLIEVLGHAATTYATRARQGREIGKWAGLHKEISDAIAEVERNTSPALVLESLVCRMFSHWHPHEGSPQRLS